MSHFSFIDSPLALKKAILKNPKTNIIIDNPILMHSDSTKRNFINIESLISRKHSIFLGNKSAGLSVQLQKKLNTPIFWEFYKLKPNSLVIGNVFFRLISGLLYRSRNLALFLNEYSPSSLDLFLSKTPAFDKGITSMPARFSNPAVSLHNLNFFKDINSNLYPIDFTNPTHTNDTSVKNTLIRLMPYSKVFLFNFLVVNMLKGIFFKKDLVFGELNDALKEALPYLVFKRFSFNKVLPIPKLRCFNNYKNNFNKLDDPINIYILPFIKKYIEKNIGFNKHQSFAISKLICSHICAEFRATRDIMPSLVSWFENSFSLKANVFATNALKGLVGRQILEMCRDRGIKVVEFEHGVTAGISAAADFKHKNLMPVSADCFLVSSKTAAKAVKNQENIKNFIAKDIGLAYQTISIFNRNLQKHYSKKLLKINNNKKTLFHVSTSPMSANLRNGLYETTDEKVLELDQVFIERIYPKINYNIIFKQYPTQRYPFEPNYDQFFNIASNIKIHKGEDLRYTRAKADLIITMRPTSTLGWCIGANVPLIWLDSKYINPLSNSKIRAGFKEAFIFIDLDSINWESKFKKILEMRYDTLLELWNSKKRIRKKVIKEHLSSEYKSIGKRSYDIIYK